MPTSFPARIGEASVETVIRFQKAAGSHRLVAPQEALKGQEPLNGGLQSSFDSALRPAPNRNKCHDRLSEAVLLRARRLKVE